MIRPRPAPGRPSAATRTAAFTLVEVLVVVAIVGIMVAVAAVNLFPSAIETSRRESSAVALAVEHARDAAWFGGTPAAITFDDGRLREWRLAGDQWKLDAARERTLPTGMRVTGLFVDGQPLDPRERLVFLPDGFGIPFSVALESRGYAWSVEGDAVGTVMLVQR